ncbi:DUF1648 domain-containing protein [Paenibacillus protaetiae]|uniref:DUF1648 domain-containing protein n=1 Tax=Paenibacillus protaetiae TaxID=2509456 RepID=A0A4P6ESL1_9BACL|nr:DUF5808 domain-containing protein [Paenibacillus protaetiae]QAY65884.1 DUF1648 domain-containing protein [Paenibacillus protaetiae]
MNETAWGLILFGATDLILIASFACYPYILARAILFGVYVPEAFRNDRKVSQMRFRFTVSQILADLAAAAAVIGWALASGTKMVDALPIVVPVHLVFALLFYIVFHRKAVQLKAEQNWSLSEVQPAKRVASLKDRRKEAIMPPLSFAPHLFIPLIIMALIGMHWDQIPDSFATHFGLNGKPDHWSAKSFGSVFSLSFIQLGAGILSVLINYTIGTAKQQLDPADPEASLKKQSQFRSVLSRFVWLIMLALILFVGYGQASMLFEQSFGQVPGWVDALLPILMIAGTAILLVYSSRKGLGQNYDTAAKDDRLWKLGGTTYYNPQDPSLFVSKRSGLGMTVNFAHPVSWIIIGLLVLILAIVPFLG